MFRGILYIGFSWAHFYIEWGLKPYETQNKIIDVDFGDTDTDTDTYENTLFLSSLATWRCLADVLSWFNNTETRFSSLIGTTWKSRNNQFTHSSW